MFATECKKVLLLYSADRKQHNVETPLNARVTRRIYMLGHAGSILPVLVRTSPADRSLTHAKRNFETVEMWNLSMMDRPIVSYLAVNIMTAC